MNRKTLLGVTAVILGLFLTAYFASPLVAVRGLISAAKAGDAVALAERVDFPAFRQSLKDEMNAQLVARMRSELKGSDRAFGGLGMMLAPAIIGGAVDSLVTPETIAAMVRSGQTPSATDPARSDEVAQPAEPDNDIRQSYGYRSLDLFAVTLTDPDRPEQALDLLMERRGLFGWKLAGIDLPPPAEPN